MVHVLAFTEHDCPLLQHRLPTRDAPSRDDCLEIFSAVQLPALHHNALRHRAAAHLTHRAAAVVHRATHPHLQRHTSTDVSVGKRCAHDTQINHSTVADATKTTRYRDRDGDGDRETEEKKNKRDAPQHPGEYARCTLNKIAAFAAVMLWNSHTVCRSDPSRASWGAESKTISDVGSSDGGSGST